MYDIEPILCQDVLVRKRVDHHYDNWKKLSGVRVTRGGARLTDIGQSNSINDAQNACLITKNDNIQFPKRTMVYDPDSKQTYSVDGYRRNLYPTGGYWFTRVTLKPISNEPVDLDRILKESDGIN